MKQQTLVTLAALAVAGAASAETIFHEDFTNYRDQAPGVVQTGEFEVFNDPIGEPRSSIAGAVTKDTELFAEPKALPSGKAFDVLFSFSLGKDATLEVVFRTADGKTLVVPFAGIKDWQRAALTVKDGQLTQYVTVTNRYEPVKTFAVPGALKTFNFRFKAGGRIELTDIAIRTGEPLPDTSALNQLPALASLTQDLGPTVRVSDGSPLDLADKSYSFVPGATGVVGRLEITWDTGFVQKHPIAVGDEKFTCIVPTWGVPRLGIKKEGWIGPDAVVSFGSLATLYVRPWLKNYTCFSQIGDAAVDLVRDWTQLPPASKHVTTVEMRGAQLWIDGSYVCEIKSPRTAKDAKTVVKAALVLEKGVAWRANAAGDPNELQLWARPKAKAFASATLKVPVEGCAAPLDSADVALAHYGFHRVSYSSDTYASRKPLDGYPGEVHFRLPAAPYVQAEILFCLDDAPGKVPLLNARLACYDKNLGSGNTEIEDATLDLTKGLPPSVQEVGTVVRSGKEYPLYKTTIDLPLGRCLDFAAGEFIDIEFLGPMEENLQQDDRRKKPRADVSSAFNLFGVKLRALNVLPELVQTSPGNVFTEDEETKTTSVKLTALVDDAKGVLKFGEKTIPYALAKAGDVVTNTYDFSDAKAGWYSVPVFIDDGRVNLRHDLVYCVTPEAGRLATAEESPYATWWFQWISEGSVGGPLLYKAGIRKNSIHPLTPEENAKYGLTSEGFVYAPKEGQFDVKTGKFRGGKLKKDGKMVDVDGEELVVAKMKEDIAKKPFVDHIMIWHESAPGCGIPEEILGLPAPTNDVAREKRVAAYVNEVGRICRKHFPELKIQVGNTIHGIGAAAVTLRGGANPDYIDQFGIEIPSQVIPPERLFEFGLLGQNVTKAVAKKLSGRDIPSAGCYEFTYRSLYDMGVDGEEISARYLARDILISLMNNYRLIAPETFIEDRSSYCNSGYGRSGILHRTPYVYPTKAYLSYAVATKVLDGVKFVRELPTGSTTVYASEFLRKDGKVATAFWCARGEVDLVCDVKGELWTMYGARSGVGGWFSDATFTCSGAPVYVISSKPCKSVKIVGRRFADDAKFAALGQKVADFSTANVTVSPDPEVESMHHNFLPYLKPGVFAVKDVEDPEEGACLELTLDTTAKRPFPVTEFVTEYTTLRFKSPVAVPGRAALFGLRVKGDSNWGQVRFEIEDAEGEVFKGLSTGKSWGCDIYDWPGYTALSFDGWNDVYQTTDANDFDLVISPGPRDEQWCSMTGGNKKIDWPVKLRAVTVGVNRFKPTILGFEKSESPSIRLKRVWFANVVQNKLTGG